MFEYNARLTTRSNGATTTGTAFNLNQRIVEAGHAILADY